MAFVLKTLDDLPSDEEEENEKTLFDQLNLLNHQPAKTRNIPIRVDYDTEEDSDDETDFQTNFKDEINVNREFFNDNTAVVKLNLHRMIETIKKNVVQSQHVNIQLQNAKEKLMNMNVKAMQRLFTKLAKPETKDLNVNEINYLIFIQGLGLVIKDNKNFDF